jgi:very-short-patch-repair endonuclease
MKAKVIARGLRYASTDAEKYLWSRIRNRNLGGFKFRRQHPLPPYAVDFVCLDRTLVLELDGGQHLEQVEADERRSAFLRAKGFRIIRFWNDDVLKQTDAVLEEILAQLTGP